MSGVSEIEADDRAPPRIDAMTLSPTKAQLRQARVEEQRVDAAKVRDEMALAVIERDAKTVRLRALRLAKEAADREAAAALPPKVKSRTRKVAAR